MAQSLHKIDVYIEAGQKRTFAGSVDWPGWCRSGRDETSALQALFDYGPRYARALRTSRLGFKAPTDASAFAVTERLEGNGTTDFGAPGIAPSADTRPVSAGIFGARRNPCEGTARWPPLESAVLRPPRRLAYPRSCLGDRRPHLLRSKIPPSLIVTALL